MTTESMCYWIDAILAPYIEMVKTVLEDENLKCVIIGDGLKAHFNEKVDESFSKIGGITTIPLPSHSSHLSQMLDCSVFSSLKRRYSSIPGNKKFESRFTRKLMRIKQAYEVSI